MVRAHVTTPDGQKAHAYCQSVESMQEYLDMDIEEQMRVTFGQADALLVS
jgi:hypothetical protein